MAHFNVPGATFDQETGATTAPLVVLFERDDAIAVPLLSQLRLAGYDVRSSRTPVELFDILSKHLVSLVLVDLGTATAGRREFWVALDAHRRGRAMQVMTYRFVQPGGIFDLDFDTAPRALADIEVQGAQDIQRLIDYVRQRIPLNGAATPPATSWPNAPVPSVQQNGGIPPIGAVLGVPSPFASSPFSTPPHVPQPRMPYGAQPAIQPGITPPAATPHPLQQPSPFAQSTPWNPAQQQPASQPFAPPAAPEVNSPFANPVTSNPFTPEYEQSPFAQPLRANPFGGEVSTSPAPGTMQPAGPSQQPEWGTPRNVSSHWSAGIPTMQPVPVGSPAAAAFEYPFMHDTVRGGMQSQAEHGWDHSLPKERAASPFSSPWSEPFDSTPAQQPVPQPAGQPFMDAWTPPEDDTESVDTGIMQKVSFSPRLTSMESPVSTESASPHRRHFHTDGGELTQATEPVPASFADMTSRLPVAASQTSTDRALGSVLVDGALLTSQRLEVLRGIQSMLSGVDMHFKIGELALLFKFLSPDQLLAALLVSRGLISPQQIAGLGRVKQELAASGMDYDLEGLLEMFHILPREQLRTLRSELA